MATDVRSLEGRITSTYLVSTRQWRQDDARFAEWHTRIDDAYDLLRGDFLTITTGEEAVIDKPLVMNTAEKFVRDVARLVAETEPIAQGYPKNDKKDQEEAALVRAAIADTYWEENEGETYEPQWAIDLLVSGAAFAVAWADPDDDEGYGFAYPRFQRVDPRTCYPFIQNGKMKDLLVVRRYKALVLDRMYPGRGIAAAYKAGRKNDGWDETVELWEYYADDELVRAVAFTKAGKFAQNRTTILERVNPGLGCPLAVMTKLPTWDDFFRGQLDQSKGSLYAKNKVVKLVFDHTEEAVEASLFARGIKNPDEPPGPDRVYVADENWPDGKGQPDIGRVAPPPIAPHLMPMLQLIDAEQRGQLAYPASRQGQVSQSIASAAFVESTQGDLSSVVKEIHRLLARMRMELTRVLAKLDIKHLNEQKPMCRSIGTKRMYTPSKDWEDMFKVKFVYGPQSGVGELNALQALIQMQAIGAMSLDTFRTHQPNAFYDVEREGEKIEREVNKKAIQQRFLTDPSVTIDEIALTLDIQEKEGVDVVTAYRKARTMAAQELAQQQAAQQPAAAQPGALPEPAAPVDAQAEALALEKGKVPDQGGPEQLTVEESAPPRPLAQVFI